MSPAERQCRRKSTMKLNQLKTTVEEAKRFVARAKALIEDQTQPLGDHVNLGIYGSPKLQGAVRRSSLDLTRSLADLRRRDES